MGLVEEATRTQLRELLAQFDDLSRHFDVQGVPRTVVNRTGSFVGALPERKFVQSVLHLAQGSAGGGELK